MKCLTLVLLAIFSSTSFASEGIKDRWIYKGDECKSGVNPKDRWAMLGSRTINFFLFDKEFAATAVFQTSDFSVTCSGSVSGVYEVSGDKLTETIKVVNQGSLENCGIEIQSPVDTPKTSTYEIKGNVLRLYRPTGGQNICSSDDDLIEVYERSLEDK